VIESLARGAQFLLAIGIAYLIAIWFALAAWTFRDIESRSRSVFTQVFSTLLVVLFFVPGLLLYLILRPKETLDQAFQRALEEEYLLQDLDDLPLCPGCQRAVDSDFVLCPHCQTRLRGACPACTRLIDLRWNVCPYCAVPVDRTAIEGAAAEPIRMLEGGRGDRRRRAIAAAAQRVGLEAEELDALQEALASGSHAAVAAGSAGDETTRRFGGLGDLSWFRNGAREAQSGLDVNGGAAPDETTTSEETPPASSRGSDGFWAEPLPGNEATRARERGGRS
jgi:hypothetical protein